MAVTVEKLATTLEAKLKLKVPAPTLLKGLHTLKVLPEEVQALDAAVPGMTKVQLTQLVAFLKQPASAQTAEPPKAPDAVKPKASQSTLTLKSKTASLKRAQDTNADGPMIVTKKRRTVKKPLFESEPAEEVEEKAADTKAPASEVVDDTKPAAAPQKKNDPAVTHRPTPPKQAPDGLAARTPQKKSGAPDEAHTKKRGRSKRSEAVQEMRDREELEALSRYGTEKAFRPRGRRRVTVKTHETRRLAQGFSKPVEAAVKEVALPESMTVGDLAQKMAVKAAAVVKVLMGMGEMATINQVIDQSTAALVVEEMGHKVKLLSADEIEESLMEALDFTAEEEAPRAPVVTIMGHVDHGKTSLLDYIRRTKVTSGEAGGITQHIGAYHVETDKGVVTFLDTPGHEAFTAMRARGTKCTDIVILVVAADDGVMPQTVEAIQHAQAAGVPIIVAVNKMDKPEADPDRIRSELSKHNVISEAWGGDVIFQPVSAKTGDGIDDLLDSILLQADVLELTARITGPAKGVIIESRLDKARGPVASILVTGGQLRKGDIILAGREHGRVRSMLGDDGCIKQTMGPSMPVEVLGLSGAPVAGDDVVVVQDERRAREVAQFRQTRFRATRFARQKAANLESLFSSMTEQAASGLNVVLKADVQGSLEAIQDALNKLATDEVRVSIVASGVGGISESDIHLATASSAVVLGFNVRATAGARQLVEKEGVDLRYYSIIYDLIDEVRSALSGMLAPEFKENIVGLAEVRDVFRSSKLGAVAGCMVVEGTMRRNLPIRVLRDDVVIYEGALESLRRYKDDMAEVTHGKECGIGVKNYNDVKVGDKIETYERIEVKRSL